MAAPLLPSAPAPAAPGILEPVPSPLSRLLRRAVLDHGRGERRRVFPACVHVGVPGHECAAIVLDADVATDHALRVDMLEAMIRRVRRPGAPPIVWLTRTGELDVQDVDAAWLAAARAAAGETGTTVSMVVVNRHSWRDPVSGVGRTWRRLR